jgi:hypothetical protein
MAIYGYSQLFFTILIYFTLGYKNWLFYVFFGIINYSSLCYL